MKPIAVDFPGSTPDRGENYSGKKCTGTFLSRCLLRIQEKKNKIYNTVVRGCANGKRRGSRPPPTRRAG